LLPKESCNEGASFSKKDMPELQDCSTQGRGICHLHGQEAQAKTGLNQFILSELKLLPDKPIRYNVLFTLSSTNSSRST
jgi:hypothetical protein